MTATEKTIDLPHLQHLLEQLSRIICTSHQAEGDAKATPALQIVDNARVAERDPTLVLANDIYSFRRKRTKFFSSDLFADPGWDILLELYRRRLENKRSSVKCICIASGVPPTTALRWINILIEQGLVTRTSDLTDHRIRWISLTDEGYDSMRALLQSAIGVDQASERDFPARRVLGGFR